MKLIKVSSCEPAAKHFAEKILKVLSENKKVFWLITGGSNIDVAVRTDELIKTHDLRNLTITLTDERFGPAGHPDSNWQQLKEAGFEGSGANIVQILNNEDFEKTARNFSENLAKFFAESDYCIGSFGIGPDGHTAGILLGSPNINSPNMATYFYDREINIEPIEGVRRGYDRITMTPAAIMKLDEAVVYTTGKSKWPSIKKLESNLSIVDEPAQALKQVPLLTIYNDYKGESLA